MKRLLALFKRDRTLTPVVDAAVAPLRQAGRCLDAWLREEGRSLSPRQKQRATALIARYFAHEDDVSDALILSFLRHYGGMGVVDMEDPQAVRMELKSVLDRSITLPHGGVSPRWRLAVAACTGMLAMASILAVMYLSQQTLTVAEQNSLRTAVAARAVQQGVAPATIWADLKRELGVTRYQDIRRWDYDRALARVTP